MAQNRLEKYCFTWKSDYKDEVPYELIDGVYHNSGIHVCKKACKGIAPPNAEYWDTMLLSATLVDRQAAEAAATLAGQHKDAAAASAQGAAGSATLAGQHMDAAAASAQGAAGSATTAGQHKDAAAGSAQAAATSETNAAASATAAQEAAASVDGAGLMAAIADRVSKAGDTMTGTLYVPEVVEDGVSLSNKYMRGEQLFDNWDWRDPVNRRGGGVSGAISTPGDFLERWRLVSGTVTVNAANMQFSAGAKIEQRTLRKALAGKEVTVSILLLDGSIKQGTGIMPTSGAVGVPIDGFGTGVLGYHADYLYTQLQAAAAVTALAVKLEIGNTSTLMADPPMDRAQMLTVCANYYRTVTMLLVAINTTRLQGANWPEMHKRPTVVLYPGTSTIDWSRPNYIVTYNKPGEYKESQSPAEITTSGFPFCNTTSTLELGQWYRAHAVIDASL